MRGGRTFAVLLAAAMLAFPSLALAQRSPLIRIPIPQDEGSLTPYTFELGYPLVTLLYDTIMWRDARGVPRPWLARSIRRSANGRTLTIQLRRGVRWHDGRPLTARDVVFTIGFLADHPHPRFTPQLEALDSVQAADDYTVVFRLAHPSLGFLDQPLSDLPILPRHIWQGLPPDRLAPPGLPVGSGPYRLIEHRAGVRYVLGANRRYFRGTPRVQRIEVPIIQRADDMLVALKRRRIDAITVPLTPAAADQVDDLGVRIVQAPSYTGTVLMLNTRRPPFDRPGVRQAVACAIDPDRVALALSETPAERGAVPADRGYLHPASRWAPHLPLRSFDPARAHARFGELGIGPVPVLAPENDPARLEAGRQVVLALRRAGARARLVTLTQASLARAVGETGATPTFEAAIWNAPALASHDPDYMRAVFGDPADPALAPLNYTGYASDDFGRLAARVAAAPAPAQRRAAIDAELRQLARDAPVVPLFFFEGRFAYRPAVYDGWVNVRGNGILDKRSFLPGESSRAGSESPSAGAAGPLAPRSGDSGFELGPFGIAAIVLAGVLLLAGVANVVPAGRRR